MGRKNHRPNLGFAITNRPATLAPKMKATNTKQETAVKYSLKVSNRDIKESETKKWAFIKGIEKRPTCKVHISGQDGENAREIFLAGSKEVVFKAREKIKKLLLLYTIS
ncbi:hypothetical protein BKA61DRAFT_737080 [Leptodontidium sp. MPI-SDFR-AT-0119]|nr:hypothetical protein BKA61DRAFT_737080 [Leptodontidium sp. MPI-SDFR-AT-0119]